MCFYDANEMACRCWKWGHFRQHCAKEYRTGETCGMKLVMNRYSLPTKCKICTKIDTKERSIRKEEERIRRWRDRRKGGSYSEDQRMKDNFRAIKQEMRSEFIEKQSDSSDDQLMKEDWDEIEKLKADMDSLLEERTRERSQTGIPMSGESSLSISKSPITTSALTHNTAAAMGSANTSSSSSGEEEKEVVGRLTPSIRFFPIDTLKDATLIFSWQEMMPTIKPLLCDDQDTSLSVTLLRQGKTPDDSEPVARIQTTKPRSEERQREIILSIEQALFPLSSPRIFFVVGSLRRTAKQSDLHLRASTARNTAFLRRPPMGVSIGIEGSTEDTATLGGYVYIDDVPYILTVHHLFTDADSGEVFKPGTIITQPSLQEVKEAGVLWDRLRSSGEFFHLDCVKKAFEDLKACLPEFPFGQLENSSGYRNRPSRDGFFNIEMDWAICKVHNTRVGSNISPCENHFCQGIAPVTPGGPVFAIGRTSGQQTGNVNGSRTNLFLRNKDGSFRESEEWAVLPPQTQEEETWLTSGIGVDGDSGAWILEDGTDNLVGQVWGRDFQDGGGNDGTGDIITYFTPIQDIFDDILQSTGATEISISSKGKPNEEEEEGKGKKKGSSIENYSSQTFGQFGGASRTQKRFTSGASTTFMFAVDERIVPCNMCVDLRRCRCLMVCIFGTLMSPPAKKNICGICHKAVHPVRDKRPQNVGSAPNHSLRSRMVGMAGFGSGSRSVSIAEAQETIYNYQIELQRLMCERDERRGTLA